MSAMFPEVVSVVCRADWVPGPPQGQWTWEDYAALPDDGNRYEVIEGVLYMAPAPDAEHHQGASTYISGNLFNQVELTRIGRVFTAPVDLQLPGRTGNLQPDVVVVLRTNTRCTVGPRLIGVPDLVVEIASPGTARYDRRDKEDAYAAAGIPEYWVADPRAKTIEVLNLEDGHYHSLGVFSGAARLPSLVLPELPVMVEQMFPA